MEAHSGNGLKARLRSLLRSVGIRHGAITSAAMILAGVLDYAVNVLAGRWLQPVEFGTFVCVAAILQVLTYLAICIRNVVAFYTAKLSAQSDPFSQMGAFVRHAWRWSWQWGLLGTALVGLISPFMAHLLRLPNPWPLWAATPVVVLLFARAITDGALQGMQAFAGFGVVQVSQSLLRLLFAAGLIWLGWQAAGAIAALPLAMAAVLVLAMRYLGPYFRDKRQVAARPISWQYSSYTLLGLATFAVMANLDALFVKLFFSPRLAGNYAPVVALAKASLFVALAMGIILLPKAVQSQAAGRDARPILLLALTAALLPGLLLTVLYFLSPGSVVRIIFTNAYSNPGIILGLASLAATLYAGLNIWLNYALSLERPTFIYALVGVLVWQGAGMFVFGRESLVHMTLVMVSAGVLGNVAGFITNWYTVPARRPVRAEVVRP
jgi:O-antigen/teichoic acid export membrane protein